MANKVLFLLTCPLTPETTIETDERIKAVRDVIAMGGFTDSKGVPLTLESFEFHYLVAESCFTPTGVLSPSKWKKLYKIEDFDRVIKDFGAVIVVEPTFTRLLTKDIFYTAVKNKYSYKQVNFFPVYPCKDLVDPRIEEALMRVDAAYSTANSESISAPSTTEVRIIRDREGIDDMWLTVLNTGLCCFDVETNEIDAGKKEGRIRYFQQGFKITTLSISPACGISYVMSIEHKDFVWEREDFLYLLQVLRKIFKNKDVVKIAQNIKYDLNALSVYGITQYAGEFNDTMLMGHLLNENEEVSLERFTQLYLPTFHGYKIKNFNIGFEELAKYNAQDTDNTLRIFVHFECKLRADIRRYKIYRNLSLSTFWVLHNAERHGALVDPDYIAKSIDECEELIERKRLEMMAHPMVLKYRYHKAIREETARLAKKKLELGFVGEERAAELIEKTEINFGSPKQLSELLFDKNIGFGIVALEDDTKEQTTSTRHEILASIDDEFVTTLLQFRALEKTLGTFFKGLADKEHEGRIHMSFRQVGTVTGRLSCVTLDTQLQTSNGLLNIGTLVTEAASLDISEQGVQVLTHDGSYQLVTHSLNQGVQEIYEVELETGEKIKCTENHRFFTNKGWYFLKDILSLSSEDSNNLKIIKYG